MKSQIITRAIVLSRINYGEADRILTLLTPDYGKISAIAKGVRKVRSKMAGGVELFSISEVGYIPGKGEVSTLTTTRLKKHFGNIVKNVERSMIGYDVIKLLNAVTEHQADKEYFELLETSLELLNDDKYSTDMMLMWLNLNLLSVAGHKPNLVIDDKGNKLSEKKKYNFDVASMTFSAHSRGKYTSDHIKLLRLALSVKPFKLHQIKNAKELSEELKFLCQSMRDYHMHV